MSSDNPEKKASKKKIIMRSDIASTGKYTKINSLAYD
jgi:hypothetical protein